MKRNGHIWPHIRRERLKMKNSIQQIYLTPLPPLGPTNKNLPLLKKNLPLKKSHVFHSTRFVHIYLMGKKYYITPGYPLS